jgi:hypothetical protein
MEMTKGQLLQVNFAPTWNGRTAGEAHKIVVKVVNVDDPMPDEQLRNLCAWRSETVTVVTVLRKNAILHAFFMHV